MKEARKEKGDSEFLNVVAGKEDRGQHFSVLRRKIKDIYLS